MKLYRERCSVCGGGSAGIHTGEVPPLAEIIKRGPVKVSQMNWDSVVCGWACSERFRAGERFGVKQAVLL